MDQRAEARIAVNADVEVEVLGDRPERMQAGLTNLSARGMRLATVRPIVEESALRIRLDGDLYLGEVTYCVAEDGGYSVGVALFNVMRNAEEVSKRLNRILQPR